jgi:hypothetical protein
MGSMGNSFSKYPVRFSFETEPDIRWYLYKDGAKQKVYQTRLNGLDRRKAVNSVFLRLIPFPP